MPPDVLRILRTTTLIISKTVAIRRAMGHIVAEAACIVRNSTSSWWAMNPVIEDSNRFGRLAEEPLAAFEASLGGRLPEDYRAFLLEHNGGRPRPATFTISKGEGETNVHTLYGLHDGP